MCCPFVFPLAVAMVLSMYYISACLNALVGHNKVLPLLLLLLPPPLPLNRTFPAGNYHPFPIRIFFPPEIEITTPSRQEKVSYLKLPSIPVRNIIPAIPVIFESSSVFFKTTVSGQHICRLFPSQPEFLRATQSQTAIHHITHAPQPTTHQHIHSYTHTYIRT